MALAVASDRALATITTDKRSVFIKRGNTVIPSELHGKNTTFVFIVFLGVPAVFGSARRKKRHKNVAGRRTAAVE
jgi:hypothetical protein